MFRVFSLTVFSRLQQLPHLRTMSASAHSDVPTFAEPGTTFLGVTSTNRDAEFVVAGIPYDIGTTNRSGARFAPAVCNQN